MSVAEAPGAEPTTADQLFGRWVSSYGASLDEGDPGRAADLFTDDCYWRDILAFTWDYRTYSGPREVEKVLQETLPTVRPHSFRPAAGRMPPRKVRRLGRMVIEGFVDFDTDMGRGVGFVRLLATDDTERVPRAWLMVTTLHELRGFEEQTGPRRPSGLEYSYTFGGDNWLDQRRKAAEFADRNPQVVVVGAGQAGLSLAARLTQLGVETLVIERRARIGDNWRQRYSSLTLHNEVWANHLPYLPFPETWPVFVPKDKLAGWLEAYAEFMELNTWTGTELIGADYDVDARQWNLRLRRDDGSLRELRTPHVVLATGSVSGVPRIPSLPGLDRFRGEVLHSSQFTSGVGYRGKRAIVVGTGNSGHDVAQDLHANGAGVTMLQRSPTCVVSLVPSGTLLYALYTEGPADDIDLITAAIPYPLLREAYQGLTKKMRSIDKDLLDGLASAGFETDFGVDDTGFHMMYLRRGGGYYIDVGCSRLIAEGQIAVVQAKDAVEFTAEGLTRSDGTTVPADLVVLATGYENQQEGVRRLFGDAVAERVGPVWGFDEHGFMRNMWRPTGQDRLWLMGGALTECRFWSRFLALQIKADLEGISPLAGRSPQDGP